MSNELTSPIIGKLTDEIVEHHEKIKFHARGMLKEAAEAGLKLIEVRDNPDRNKPFKQWVPENTGISYRQAAKYMQVARLQIEGAEVGTFEGGIDRFLEHHATKRQDEQFEDQASTFIEPDSIKLSLDSNSGKHPAIAHALSLGIPESIREAEKLLEGAKMWEAFENPEKSYNASHLIWSLTENAEAYFWMLVQREPEIAHEILMKRLSFEGAVGMVHKIYKMGIYSKDKAEAKKYAKAFVANPEKYIDAWLDTALKGK